VRRHRRLRRLQPDAELIRRRAAGETLRQLATDYGVWHTTLGRYFARPQVARQLKQAQRLERLERRAAEARWWAEQKAAERQGQAREQKPARAQPRRSARQPEQASADAPANQSKQPVAAASPPLPQPETPLASGTSATIGLPRPQGRQPPQRRQPAAGRSRRPRAHPYQAWLDEREAPAPPTPPEQRRVEIRTATGKVVARGERAGAERIRESLERRLGPVTIVPL
jgi:hypothetical protein